MPDRKFLASLSILVSSVCEDSFNTIKDGMVEGSVVLNSSDYENESVFSLATRLKPDVIMLVYREMDEAALDELSELTQSLLIPVLVFVKSDEGSFARHVIRLGACAFVVDGLMSTRMQSLVEVAIERFKLNTALHAELQKSKETLASRKVIEKAKGLLMASRTMSEDEAYKALRNMAMRQGKPLREVSESMIVMLETLQ